MKRVWIVHHVHEWSDGHEDVKLIGIYSSRERAESALERTAAQPGFRDSRNGLSIDEQELDRDHWTEGFFTTDSMITLFPCDPTRPAEVDPDYAQERAAVDLAAVVDHDAILRRDPAAFARVPAADTIGVYRGWMLPVDAYAWMYETLLAASVRLVNDPAQYRACHHLPETLAVLGDRTPATQWIACDASVSMERVHETIAPFGSKPIVVKDFVKSRKHEWNEACFIPDASDRRHVERVVRRFLELQGDSLTGGLVFRELAELEPIGIHPKSGMPLTREHRFFFLDGAPILDAGYWGPDVARPPVEEFLDLARRVPSRFFTMDVAKKRDGAWIVIELGDAQVAGLPDGADPHAFMNALARAL